MKSYFFRAESAKKKSQWQKCNTKRQSVIHGAGSLGVVLWNRLPFLFFASCSACTLCTECTFGRAAPSIFHACTLIAFRFRIGTQTKVDISIISKCVCKTDKKQTIIFSFICTGRKLPSSPVPLNKPESKKLVANLDYPSSTIAQAHKH